MLPLTPLLSPSPKLLPIRLFEPETATPATSGPDVWPATMVLVSVVVWRFSTPPPELPLTVQFVSVVVPARLLGLPVVRPPPAERAELPLMVQSVSVAVP